MEIYFAAFVIALLPHLLYPSEKRYKYNLLFSMIIVFLLGATRFGFNDFKEYEFWWEYARDYETKDWHLIHMEYGYMLFCKLFPDFRHLLIATSLIWSSAVYFLFLRHLNYRNIKIALLLFFLGGDKTILFATGSPRSALAISLFIFSSYFIIHRKIVYFTAMTMVAYFIHNSSVIFMPLSYLLCSKYEITLKTINIWNKIFIGAVVIQIVGIAFLAPLISIYFAKYSVYMENTTSFGMSSIVTIFIVYLVNNMIKHNIKIYGKPFINDMDGMGTLYCLSNLFFIGLLLSSVLLRSMHFFYTFFIVFCSIIIDDKRNINRGFIFTIVFIIIIFQFIMPMYQYWWMPYQSLWFHEQ